MLKSYLFYGYTKKSVEAEFKKLYHQMAELETQIRTKDNLIEDLTEQIRRTKSEERLIQEAILDAHEMSKKIIQEAQQKAEELMTYVEGDVTTKLDNVTKNFSSIKQTKQDLLSQEDVARQELKESLNRYLALIDQHSQTFAMQNNILEVDFKSVEESLNRTKTIVNQTATEKKQATAEVEEETKDNVVRLKLAQG